MCGLTSSRAVTSALSHSCVVFVLTSVFVRRNAALTSFSSCVRAALKSPAAFHEQRKSLERARVSGAGALEVAVRWFWLSLVRFPPPQTEDYLKRKIRSRPERSELVRMHILEGEFTNSLKL